MNKPAPKEPSMDEILSSIRQIIADDDASSMPAPAPAPPAADVSLSLVRPEDEPPRVAPAAGLRAVPNAEPEPLALSAEQILEVPADALDFSAFTRQDPVAAAPVEDVAAAVFIDPDDIAFEPEPLPEPEPVPPPVRVAPPPPPPVEQRERPRPTPAQAAPMPDPRLSADIAEELLEPTTNAAVRSNFSRLASLGVGTPSLTIEALVRDMLRPMLKEWLDENLPTVVERMVEKEIARISRGIDTP